MANELYGNSTTSGPKLAQSSRENNPKSVENERLFQDAIKGKSNCVCVQLPPVGDPIDLVALMQEFLEKVKTALQGRAGNTPFMRVEETPTGVRRFLLGSWVKDEMNKHIAKGTSPQGPSPFLLATQKGTALVLETIFPNGKPEDLDISVQVLPGATAEDDQEVVVSRITHTPI